METLGRSEFCEGGRPRSLLGLKSIPSATVGGFLVVRRAQGGGSAFTRPKLTSRCELDRQCKCVHVCAGGVGEVPRESGWGAEAGGCEGEVGGQGSPDMRREWPELPVRGREESISRPSVGQA